MDQPELDELLGALSECLDHPEAYSLEPHGHYGNMRSLQSSMPMSADDAGLLPLSSAAAPHANHQTCGHIWHGNSFSSGPTNGPVVQEPANLNGAKQLPKQRSRNEERGNSVRSGSVRIKDKNTRVKKQILALQTEYELKVQQALHLQQENEKLRHKTVLLDSLVSRLEWNLSVMSLSSRPPSTHSLALTDPMPASARGTEDAANHVPQHGQIGASPAVAAVAAAAAGTEASGLIGSLGVEATASAAAAVSAALAAGSSASPPSRNGTEAAGARCNEHGAQLFEQQQQQQQQQQHGHSSPGRHLHQQQPQHQGAPHHHPVWGPDPCVNLHKTAKEALETWLAGQPDGTEAKMAGMTLEQLVEGWKAFLAVAAPALVALESDPNDEQAAIALLDAMARVIASFRQAALSQDVTLMFQIQALNMDTMRPQEPPPGHWCKVLQALDPSPSQQRDMRAAWQIYNRLKSTAREEKAQALERLTAPALYAPATEGQAAPGVPAAATATRQAAAAIAAAAAAAAAEAAAAGAAEARAADSAMAASLHSDAAVLRHFDGVKLLEKALRREKTCLILIWTLYYDQICTALQYVKQAVHSWPFLPEVACICAAVASLGEEEDAQQQPAAVCPPAQQQHQQQQESVEQARASQPSPAAPPPAPPHAQLQQASALPYQQQQAHVPAGWAPPPPHAQMHAPALQQQQQQQFQHVQTYAPALQRQQQQQQRHAQPRVPPVHEQQPRLRRQRHDTPGSRQDGQAAQQQQQQHQYQQQQYQQQQYQQQQYQQQQYQRHHHHYQQQQYQYQQQQQQQHAAMAMSFPTPASGILHQQPQPVVQYHPQQNQPNQWLQQPVVQEQVQLLQHHQQQLLQQQSQLARQQQLLQQLLQSLGAQPQLSQDQLQHLG